MIEYANKSMRKANILERTNLWGKQIFWKAQIYEERL